MVILQHHIGVGEGSVVLAREGGGCGHRRFSVVLGTHSSAASRQRLRIGCVNCVLSCKGLPYLQYQLRPTRGACANGQRWLASCGAAPGGARSVHGPCALTATSHM